MSENALRQSDELENKDNFESQELPGDLNEIPILSFDDDLSADFDDSLLAGEEAIIDYVEEEDGIDQEIIDELKTHNQAQALKEID